MPKGSIFFIGLLAFTVYAVATTSDKLAINGGYRGLTLHEECKRQSGYDTRFEMRQSQRLFMECVKNNAYQSTNYKVK